MGFFRRFLLALRTARHLRPRQLVYLLVRRAQERLSSRRMGRAQHPPEGLSDRAERFRGAVSAWGSGDLAERLENARRVLAGQFRFLGVTRELEPGEWRPRESMLWLYNLHYFDYAVDLAWAAREGLDGAARHLVRLVDDWVDRHEEASSFAWDPYPMSIRAVNWIHAAMIAWDQLAVAGRERLLQEAYVQLGWVERRLEYHIEANHLQKNVAALATGALVLGRPAHFDPVERLWKLLFDQTLEDGGHFERSSMYHLIAAADFFQVADLARVAGRTPPPDVRERLALMLEAAAVLVRPDGTLHLFNDAAEGVAPSVEQVRHLGRLALNRAGGARSRRLGGTSEGRLLDLPETGYFGFESESRGIRLVIDAGPVGAAYQPGHAHCDILSFELDLDGVALVVDSGVAGYGGDPYRPYVRSTRAHNTLELDGREQAEIWDTFRVARRPRRIHGEHSLGNGRYEFSGRYSPYFRRSALHMRRISVEGRVVRIEDYLRNVRRGRSFLHFHPDWELRSRGAGYVALRGDAQVEIAPFGTTRSRIAQGETEPIQGWYCPRFGQAVPAATLIMDVDVAGPEPCGFELRGRE